MLPFIFCAESLWCELVTFPFISDQSFVLCYRLLSFLLFRLQASAGFWDGISREVMNVSAPPVLHYSVHHQNNNWRDANAGENRGEEENMSRVSLSNELKL